MNEDGTVNRAALPAIFNPEDLHALELALQIKDRYGGKVSVITMGLPAASEVLRQALYRGADEAILITDPRCAASDTLATSYILNCAVRRLPFDIVLCGRQAIDGDTAQVGPQTAEKLGILQVSYVENLLGIEDQTITLRRNLGNGFQEVRGKLPVLLTVLDTANEPRVPSAKRLMKYKKSRSRAELPKDTAERDFADLTAKGLAIRQWDLDVLAADLTWCGRDGSPTKVHRIQSVVLTAKETKQIPPTEEGIRTMIHELIEDHTLG
jgi:electron transfer flavoprotein beta subunit